MLSQDPPLIQSQSPSPYSLPPVITPTTTRRVDPLYNMPTPLVSVLQHKHVCILHTVCSWFQGNTSMMSSSGVMRDLLLAPTPVQDDTYMVKVTTSAHHTTYSVCSLPNPAYTHPSCWPSQQPADGDGGYVLGRQRFHNGGRSSQERLEYHMLVGY